MDPTRHAGPPGHETSDVSIRGIVRFGIGLGVATVLTAAGMWMFFRVLERRERRVDVPIPAMVAEGLRRTPPEPRLEPNPLEPRRRMQAREDATLTTYGWVDRGAGVARIPIGRAMDLLAEKGLPASRPIVPTPGPGDGRRKAGDERRAPTP